MHCVLYIVGLCIVGHGSRVIHRGPCVKIMQDFIIGPNGPDDEKGICSC